MRRISDCELRIANCRLPRTLQGGRGGFTLLEILVASTLFSIVLGASYALFDAGQRMTEKGQYYADTYQAARGALRIIERDLKAAYLSPSEYNKGFIGTSGGNENLPLDEIEFLGINSHTVNLKDDERGIDLAQVSYGIQAEGEDIPGLVRRKKRVLLEQSLGTENDKDLEEIGRNIIGLNFRYLGDDWEDEWDSTTSGKLPKAVEVTIIIKGFKGKEELEEKFTTWFYLPLWKHVPPAEEE